MLRGISPCNYRYDDISFYKNFLKLNSAAITYRRGEADINLNEAFLNQRVMTSQRQKWLLDFRTTDLVLDNRTESRYEEEE